MTDAAADPGTAADPDPRITRELAVDPSARLHRDDDGWVLSLHRELRHGPERVWAMLTQPSQLARWSPIVPDRPLTGPGPATSRENPGDEAVDATVIEVDPPHRLVHRWGDHLLEWTVRPTGAGSVLAMRHRFADRGMASSLAGGWTVCLASLAASFDGQRDVPVERATGQRALDYGWATLRDRFDADFDGDADGNGGGGGGGRQRSGGGEA